MLCGFGFQLYFSHIEKTHLKLFVKICSSSEGNLRKVEFKNFSKLINMVKHENLSATKKYIFLIFFFSREIHLYKFYGENRSCKHLASSQEKGTTSLLCQTRDKYKTINPLLGKRNRRSSDNKRSWLTTLGVTWRQSKC